MSRIMRERLQKIISRSGIASRRAAEELMRAGRVTVNGRVVAEPGSKADPAADEIRVDGRLIRTAMAPVYIALNKPRGYITSLRDPEGRPLVTDLIVGIPERVFPAGRLDYESEGLLILTNDGVFANSIQHPRHDVPKTYLVKVRGRVMPAELQRLRIGRELEDGFFAPLCVRVKKSNEKSVWLEVELTGGRNRIVRRFLESFGKQVVRLIRIRIGELHLASLKPGEYRFLTEREVEMLVSASTGKSRKKS